MSYIPIAIAFFAIFCAVSSGPSFVPRDLQVVVQETPRPYEFGYEFGDGLGVTQHRREIADGTGAIKGNYGYVDPSGVYRKVEYTADANGYRAVVHSNEPGTANQAIGNAVYVVELPPPEVIAQGLPNNRVSKQSVQ